MDVGAALLADLAGILRGDEDMIELPWVPGVMPLKSFYQYGRSGFRRIEGLDSSLA